MHASFPERGGGGGEGGYGHFPLPHRRGRDIFIKVTLARGGGGGGEKRQAELGRSNYVMRNQPRCRGKQEGGWERRYDRAIVSICRWRDAPEKVAGWRSEDGGRVVAVKLWGWKCVCGGVPCY